MDYSQFVTSDFGSLLDPGLSVKDALDILFNGADAVDQTDSILPVEGIYISPPDPGTNIDEDSGDEEYGGNMENLNSNQLQANAEVIFSNIDNTDTSFIHPLPKKYQGKRVFIPGDLVPNPGYYFPNPDYSKFTGMAPENIFELFVNDEIISTLVRETKNYALFLNCPDPEITENEIRCFIAILILSGYSERPGKRYYWDNGDDMRQQAVFLAMRRNRLEQILRFLHCQDNNKISINDKLWKIRPIIEILQNNIRKYFVPERKISYDESMIKYYGKHSCKQFIKGKPIRFGYKVWCLNTVDGYLIDFEVYQGKSISGCANDQRQKYEDCFGKTAAPLVEMVQKLPKLHYDFFFDNLFTSFDLINYFRKQGFGATGTMRENRIPRDCPLLPKKSMLKKERGFYSSCISRKECVGLTKWRDNSVIAIASNCHSSFPLGQVKRYSRKDKRNVTIPQPNVIREYNKFMGGTDRMDEGVAMYRISIRNKKWYWPILSWLIDVSIHNSWILSKKSGSPLPQLEFRRRIVLCYLSRYGSPPMGAGRPRIFSQTFSSCSRVIEEIRFDSVDHFIVKTEENKRKRCAGNDCISKVRTMCRKCKVGLCVDCFATFHTKK